MKKHTFLFLFISICLSLESCALYCADSWWLEKPMRMIQTNLREIDASLDVDTYVQHIVDCSANVVLFNIGGIVANYPTDLPFHFRNTYLKDDFAGKVIERLHKEGIRFIGRFDFSKINEQLAAQKPEWLYKSVKGETVNYNGQVHTCINGDYQQEYLFQILGEVIDRYPVDGIFFNMIGYVTTDYSGNYYGICQCDACMKRFAEWSGGLKVPLKEDPNDPVFRKYDNFRRETSDELFYRIGKFIKSKRNSIAICTYTPAGVDIIRTESNSALDRPLPEWNYSGSDNVKTALGSWKNRTISNASVHFVDYPYRHSSVSPYLTEQRLVQNMINGGWLDHYVIGRLENQEDRKSLESVKDIFRFESANEQWFVGTKPVADVCLIKPASSSMHGSGKEYTGIFRVLAENQILFDVIDDRALLSGEDTPRKLEDYPVVVLPDVRSMSDSLCAQLDAYVENGGKILATGMTSTCDKGGNPLGQIRLKSFGVNAKYKLHPRKPGNYFRVRSFDKPLLKNQDFNYLDIVYLDSDFLECESVKSMERLLGFIPAGMFGPPEKCYYSTVTEIPGMLHYQYGKGESVFIPWLIGRHYQERSHHAHSMLVMGALEGLLKSERSVVIEDTSPLIEISRREHKDGKFGWIGIINHSGQNGTAFHKPISMYEISLRFKTTAAIKNVKLLRLNKDIKYENLENGWARCVLPKVDSFEIVVFEYK